MVLLTQNVGILTSLQTAQSYSAQTKALQALKNETVGHYMKKEKWVELGVLRPIVKVILPERPANWQAEDDQKNVGGREGGPSRSSSHNRRPSSVTPPDNLPADDMARLQALEVLGIFASGGAAFLEPLRASGALPAILSCIDPNTTHPRLIYAALRSIVTITKAARLVSVPASSPSPVTITTLADTILTAPHLQAFYNIIIASPRAWWTESITNEAVSLISPLCREPRHQLALAKAGILDALAVKVASYVVAKGQVVPGADIAAEKEGLRDAIPEPATPRLKINAVLDAVAAIMGDSRLRACMLLCAPSILAIFPQIEFETPTNDVHAAWKALSMGGLSNFDQQSLGALDFLLPAIPSQPSRGGHFLSSAHNNSSYSSIRTTFTRQASSGSSNSKRVPVFARHRQHGSGDSLEGFSEDQESPMIPWLISLVRSTSGLERLMAASVLTSLYKAGFASKQRESAMALLVVPLLLRRLDEAANAASASSSSLSTGDGISGSAAGGWEGDDDSNKTDHQAITEAALTVLARLVANSDVLQKAAIDGNAIKILSKLLKESYEPVSTRTNPRPWNPTPTGSANPSRTGTPVAGTHGGSQRGGGERLVDDADAAVGGAEDDPDGWAVQIASSKLGPAGQSSQLAYRIRLREATLKALTALVAVKYDYQRAFVDQDAMVYVVASLNATPTKPRANKDRIRSLKDVAMDVAGSGDDLDPEYGRNPVGVLVAACNCVRMLSRSIAILRTTLEDAGVAAPIFRLLRHPDTDVQVAATGVICNLLTETSPMRERYAEAGVMNILCEQAHSPNRPLRLNAIWALKHFVDGLEPSMKQACLRQLGPEWLMQLVDPDSDAASSRSTPFNTAGDNSSSRSRNNSRGNSSSGGLAAAVATPSWSFTTVANDEDVEMEQSGDDNEANTAAADEESANRAPTTAASGLPSLGSPTFLRARFPLTSHERSRTGRLRQAEDKLAALQEAEASALRKSQTDDVVIQEQALNFIRNLIGPGSYSHAAGVTGASPSAAIGLGQPASSVPRDAVNEATEMIDHLFNEIGQEALFKMLLDKVKNKVVRPAASTTGATASSSRQTATRRHPTAGDATSPPPPSSETATSPTAGLGGVARVQQPRAKIVEAVVFILVHISASIPQHRQVVISQTELLKTLVGHFSSSDKGVRVALCHLVTNLTWTDDLADAYMANMRATEIKRLGLMERLEAMQFEDPELDVREQAKMAVHQMQPATV